MFVRVSPNRLLLAGKEFYKDKFEDKEHEIPKTVNVTEKIKNDSPSEVIGAD